MKNRLSNALSKIIKQEKKGEIHQITGRLCNGMNGYCLSGALGIFFGVEKQYLERCGFMAGEQREKAFGDARFSGVCPLTGEKLRTHTPCFQHFSDIQSLIIHLNDDHRISFTEAQKIIAGLEL